MSAADPDRGGIVGPNHAVLVGQVYGALALLTPPDRWSAPTTITQVERDGVVTN